MTDARPFELQGHRGARGLFPENTIEGFRAALDLGLRAFELDVGMTADGVAVVSHDLALNPHITRDGQGEWLKGPGPLIHQLTFEALRRYDVGRIRPDSAYAHMFPDQKPFDGARIPALAEVLALDPDARFNIEVKTNPRRRNDTVSPAELVDAVLAIIQGADAADRVIVESFDWRVPRIVRDRYPTLQRAWLTEPATVRDAATWWDGVLPSDHAGSVPHAVAAEGGPIWAPHHGSLARQEVEDAHRLGLRVLPWTVNDRNDMRRLIDWGVDGLITDYPDRALPILRHLGMPTTFVSSRQKN